MTQQFSGFGPGVQTPDGCSVELYRQLPYLNELEDVIDLFAVGSTVLELGCGTGRLCRRMLERGLRVTGVDESVEMLAAMPKEVHAVASTIAAFNLQEKFDAVLLASHLINHPDLRTRDTFVACARRHLNDGGKFLLKRHDPTWLAAAKVGSVSRSGDTQLFIEHVSQDDLIVNMTLRYELAGHAWTQSFSTVALTQTEIEQQLMHHGFTNVQWHGKLALWASAIAVS